MAHCGEKKIKSYEFIYIKLLPSFSKGQLNRRRKENLSLFFVMVSVRKVGEFGNQNYPFSFVTLYFNFKTVPEINNKEGEKKNLREVFGRR